MLVIRRRPGETLVIGDNIEVEILESGATHVKLGIRAPRTVPVVRKEIQMVGEQNRAASQQIPDAAIQRLLRSLKKPSLNPISRL
jgi:carbon storage regulator